MPCVAVRLARRRSSATCPAERKALATLIWWRSSLPALAHTATMVTRRGWSSVLLVDHHRHWQGTTVKKTHIYGRADSHKVGMQCNLRWRL